MHYYVLGASIGRSHKYLQNLDYLLLGIKYAKGKEARPLSKRPARRGQQHMNMQSAHACNGTKVMTLACHKSRLQPPQIVLIVSHRA